MWLLESDRLVVLPNASYATLVRVPSPSLSLPVWKIGLFVTECPTHIVYLWVFWKLPAADQLGAERSSCLFIGPSIGLTLQRPGLPRGVGGHDPGSLP